MTTSHLIQPVDVVRDADSYWTHPGVPNSEPPRIGAIWLRQGGIYAGILRGEIGAPDYHLIHAAVEYELTGVNWKDAGEKAAVQIEGHIDWSLPNPREALLLFINTVDGFDTGSWYWTSAQLSENPDSAWVQTFLTGFRYTTHKSGEWRARAVRRLLIIE